MTYQSVDALQQVLVEKVFGYAEDRKKAAGRALGTLVEIITYYSLKAWGFRESVAIERPLPEYGNPEITHNVEFSLHPVLRQKEVPLRNFSLPLTTAKLERMLDRLEFDRHGFVSKSAVVLNKKGILRNACTFAESKTSFCIASVDEVREPQYALTVSELHFHPFAVFECKRVVLKKE
jgi:hypothetical protein